MRNKNRLSIIIFAVFALLTGMACIDKQIYTSPPGYDFYHPVKYYMPQSLKEISGIAFHHNKSDTLYTEEDEDGKVYYFHLGDKQVNYSKFGKHGDYEDIAILGEQVVLLRSDGVLFVFPFKQVRDKEIQGTQKWDSILPGGEYEGLYADEKSSQLYVLCKHCNSDNTAKSSTGYVFKLSPNGSIKQSGQFSINIRDIEAMIGQKKIEFHPSALAKNQKTGEWYILSSVNKVLVIADSNFKIKSVYPIDPSLFIQPEGIAFDEQQNLYISNEGDKVTPGTVYKFIYKK